MQNAMKSLLILNDLQVVFGQTPAVRGVSLTVHAGQTLGVVGESGSGKSTTWLAVLGLLGGHAQCSGSVRLDGTELLNADEATLTRVRGGRIAMVFQDSTSSLNPLRSIGWQIGEALQMHRGLSGSALRAETQRLLDQVGIADAANRMRALPFELSGGQNQRVMIAMALAGQPDLLIADEPTTALDATIQAQILELLRDIQKQNGMALVLISHDLAVVSEMCDDVAVMYAGQVVESAPSAVLFSTPAHPYTRGLIGAEPSLTGPVRPMQPIRGMPPQPDDMPTGCTFGPRCDLLISACRRTQTLRDIAPSHRAACVRAGAGV